LALPTKSTQSGTRWPFWEKREVRRWIRLVATLGAGQGKSSELLLSALVRARFCELLSPKIPHGESDLFLMGLLSDVILELPMSQVLDNVPIDQETKSVLLGGASRLRPFYQLMLAQESGEWKTAAELTAQLHLSENEVAECHWASHAMGTAGERRNVGGHYIYGLTGSQTVTSVQKYI
jgi:c-di-GMP-related signal transduction protein